MHHKREIAATMRQLAWHVSDLHGVAHWARVSRFGAGLSAGLHLSPAYRECVEIFAWTHDLARIDDGGGNDHARDGARYFDTYTAKVFPHLTHVQQDFIRTAIYHHADGISAEEGWHQGWFTHLEGEKADILNVMGCCWDADRLDLLRLGIEPEPHRMSTPFWDSLLPLSQRLNQWHKVSYFIP
jgi:uncharacterized protein